MSRWGTLEAEFEGVKRWARDTIAHELGDRDERAPTGSETGPSVHTSDAGTVDVSGRLRDVSDLETSPLVLAWFVRYAAASDRASLTWEIDDGPRYRYVYEEGELRKLTGVLDL